MGFKTSDITTALIQTLMAYLATNTAYSGTVVKYKWECTT